MKDLKYSELIFIENCLFYFCNKETKIMKQNQNFYSDDEIKDFRSSVMDLIFKIQKIREGE